MYKFLVSIAVSALLLGCGSPQKTQCKWSPPANAPEPTTQVVRGKGWSVEVPVAWTSDSTEKPNGDGGLTHFEACSNEANGSSQTCAMLISTPWSEAPESFGGWAGMITVSRPDINVHDVRTVVINGHKGSVVVYTSHNIAVYQVAIGIGKRGYVLGCGGAIHRVKEILETCSTISKTLRFD